MVSYVKIETSEGVLYATRAAGKRWGFWPKSGFETMFKPSHPRSPIQQEWLPTYGAVQRWHCARVAEEQSGDPEKRGYEALKDQAFWS